MKAQVVQVVVVEEDNPLGGNPTQTLFTTAGEFICSLTPSEAVEEQRPDDDGKP